MEERPHAEEDGGSIPPSSINKKKGERYIMNHVRAHIRINTPSEANAFISALNSLGDVAKYTIEDSAGEQRVNARSLLGVIYAIADYNDEMFFVNETNDGAFPSCVDKYRV